MGPLTPSEIDALQKALDDEYRAWATYDQVMADFGEAPPFSNIRAAEARHIEALCSLYARYGLPVPENPWPGKVARYANLQEASQQRHLAAFQRCVERGSGGNRFGGGAARRRGGQRSRA